MNNCRKLAVTVSVAFLLGIAHSSWAAGSVHAYGPRFKALPASALERPPFPLGTDALGHVLYWNRVAIDASGLDHTPSAPGENRVFHEQLGPGRASRATAIVHIAIFDAINAIEGGYESYTGIARVHARASVEAAIAQAAHDTLVALYPAQAAKIDELLADDLQHLDIPNKNA